MSRFLVRSILASAMVFGVTVEANARGGGGHHSSASSYSHSYSNPRSVHVNGYTKKDGTYVAPHERSAPNNTKLDNWSHKGNVNPYTGEVGTKED
ncbi:MAG: hypothetical protein JSU04_18555 [Bdellovibrionales bacterium]|nr:hypothetical protein [Bdellovibrionales bacterium]